jgi:hypothetical protein
VQNADALFFELAWARCGSNNKWARARHIELVFLPPVGSMGHVVHCGASVPQNIDALFFTLGWARYGFLKKHIGTRYTNLCFCIWLDLLVM